MNLEQIKLHRTTLHRYAGYIAKILQLYLNSFNTSRILTEDRYSIIDTKYSKLGQIPEADI